MNTVPSGERAEVPLNFSNQNHIVELLHDSSIKCNEELNNISSVQELKLASLNINDLKAHIDELKIYLAGNEIDILAINETKLNKIDKTEIVRIPGYEIVRRDRTTDKGGGVCFYVKQCINFIVREDLKITDIENICIEIRKPRSKPFIVATWYRPPNSLVEIFSFHHLKPF